MMWTGAILTASFAALQPALARLHPALAGYQPALAGHQLALVFFSPGFALAGACLVAAPILIHLLNRRRYRVVPWAAMDFLLAAMKKNRRRIRFEQWILLAARCLLVLLIGLALARPALNSASLAGLLGRRSGLHVIVIDTSVPMMAQHGGTSNLDHAKALAKQLIDRLAAGESVALIDAARPATAVLSVPTYDLKAAESAIDRLEQSYGGCDLNAALAQASDIAQQNVRQPDRSLAIITAAANSEWTGPTSEAIAAECRELMPLYPTGITHFNVGQSGMSNDAILGLRANGAVVTKRFGCDYSAQIRGFGVGPDRTLIWRLDGADLPGSQTINPPGSPLDIVNANIRPHDGGEHVLSVALAQADGRPDALEIDDARRLVVDVVSEVKVLIVEGQSGVGRLGGSGAYLQAALAPNAGTDSQAAGADASYVAPDLISDLELSNKVLGDYRAVMMCDVSQLTAAEADQLADYVKAGRSVLWFMGDNVQPDNYNTILYPRQLLPGPLTKRMSVGADQQGFAFDFQPRGPLHPMLNDFANVQDSGMDTAQIFTYWQLALPHDLPPGLNVQRVLNFIATGPGAQKDPAITLHSLGAGRVLFFATSVDPQWTSLPAKPAFVTLMHAMLLGTLPSETDWQNLTVGDRLHVPGTMKLSGTPILTDERGVALPLDSSTGSWTSNPLPRPGVYQLHDSDRTYPIAVNLPPDVSDLRMLDDVALRKAMGDIDVNLAGDAAPGESADLSVAGSDVGWTIMLAVLGLIALESYMAMRFSHHRL
jgi:hypothetical protein